MQRCIIFLDNSITKHDFLLIYSNEMSDLSLSYHTKSSFRLLIMSVKSDWGVNDGLKKALFCLDCMLYSKTSNY